MLYRFMAYEFVVSNGRISKIYSTSYCIIYIYTNTARSRYVRLQTIMAHYVLSLVALRDKIIVYGCIWTTAKFHSTYYFCSPHSISRRPSACLKVHAGTRKNTVVQTFFISRWTSPGLGVQTQPEKTFHVLPIALSPEMGRKWGWNENEGKGRTRRFVNIAYTYDGIVRYYTMCVD